MKRIARVSLAALMPLLMLMASAASLPKATSTAFGQDLPPGPKAISRSSLPGLTLQGEFELLNIVLDFAPGSATPPHTHGGPGIATVLTEEIAFGMEGQPDHVARPGEFYLDLPGTIHTAANKTSSNPARVSYVVALPKGAAVTTVVGGPPSDQLPPGPKPVYRTSLPGLTMQGEFELINLILEFAPGAATPAHTHGGPGIVTVIEGEITFGMEGKPDHVAKPGDFYLDLPGAVHTAANKTSAPARVSYLVALPKGAALTTPVGATQAPAQQAPAAPVAPAAPASAQAATAPAQQQAAVEHVEHIGMPRTGILQVSPSALLLVVALVLILLGLGSDGLARLSNARRK
jgi:quercetin dioxygenase-like cupin family protein